MFYGSVRRLDSPFNCQIFIDTGTSIEHQSELLVKSNITQFSIHYQPVVSKVGQLPDRDEPSVVMKSSNDKLVQEYGTVEPVQLQTLDIIDRSVQGAK
jgi:hypothetical protein